MSSGLSKLVYAEFLSSIGTSLALFALPVMVLTATGSATQTGLVGAALSLGVIIAPVVSGKVLSSLQPKTAMITSDLLSGAISFAIALIVVLADLQIVVLSVLICLQGALSNIFGTAQQMLVADKENDDGIYKAYSRLASANRLSTMIGPALAGVLVVHPGPWLLFLLDGVSFYISALLVHGIPVDGDTAEEAGTPTRFGAAIVMIIKDATIRSWTLSAAIGEFGWQYLFFAITYIAVIDSSSPVLAGVMFSAFSLGSFAGSLSVPALLRVFRKTQLAVVGRSVGALACFVGFLLHQDTTVLTVVMLVAGLSTGVSNPGVAALLIELIPRSMRGSIMSTRYSLNMIGQIAGRSSSGFLIALGGVGPLILLATGAQAVSAWQFRSGVRHSGLDTPEPKTADPQPNR